MEWVVAPLLPLFLFERECGSGRYPAREHVLGGAARVSTFRHQYM